MGPRSRCLGLGLAPKRNCIGDRVIPGPSRGGSPMGTKTRRTSAELSGLRPPFSDRQTIGVPLQLAGRWWRGSPMEANPRRHQIHGTSLDRNYWSSTRARHGVLQGGCKMRLHLKLNRCVWQPKRKDRPRCGAKTRAGGTCLVRVELGKARCRFHGGLSTGPKTKAGRARIAQAQRRRWRAYRERAEPAS